MTATADNRKSTAGNRNGKLIFKFVTGVIKSIRNLIYRRRETPWRIKGTEIILKKKGKKKKMEMEV